MVSQTWTPLISRGFSGNLVTSGKGQRVSTAEKIAEHAVNACSGALALWAGNPTGGVTIVKSMVGLAFLGRSLSGDPATEARNRAVAATLAALAANPDFTRADPDRVEFLLTRASFTGLTHSTLLDAVHAAEGTDLGPPLAAILAAHLPFDQDDAATTAVVGLALQSAARACAREAAFRDDLRDLMLMDLLRKHRMQDQFMSEIDVKLDRLLAEKDQTARELGLTQGLVIGLARRVAEDVADFDTALRELERALTLAAQMRDQAALPANTGDQVSEILRRLSALNDQDRLDEGADLLAAELARLEAQRVLLYEAAFNQDILRRSATSAAHWLVEWVKSDNPPDLFAALITTGKELQAESSERGLNFGIEIAIHVAQKSLDYAVGPEQRGIALNDLGIACCTLGEHEGSTARLEQAIAAHRAALEENTRDRSPLDWATTQMNLGCALLRLGEREGGTTRLVEAVVVFQAALKEFLPTTTPLDWARTLMNLGSACLAIGRRETDTAWLERAIGIYRGALLKLDRDETPRDWATTQMNLGIALGSLGERASEPAPLEEAVDAFREALSEIMRDYLPVDWARTQLNLGIVLTTLGQGEAGTTRLDEAIEAFGAALEILTRNRMPIDWAKTQVNLGRTLSAMGEREIGTQRFLEAIACYRLAAEELTPDRAPLDWANAVGNEGIAFLKLAEREADPIYAAMGFERLVEAADLLRRGGHDTHAETMMNNASIGASILTRLSGNATDSA